MNDAALSVAPVLARNCEFGCGFFHFRGYPRCRSPPDFLKFQFSNFKKNGGYIDVLRSRKSGKRIQQLRKNQSITLEELSEKLNITDRQLRRIEKGESGGSIDLLAEIAVMFNVSLDYLIMGRVLTTSDAKIALQEAIRVLSDLEQQL